MSNEYKDWKRDEEYENPPQNASYWKRRCIKAESEGIRLINQEGILLAEKEELQEENKWLVSMLENAYKRMDDARYILTDGNPTPSRNWGMLDTTLDRKALEGRE
jgi:hypothetical protein